MEDEQFPPCRMSHDTVEPWLEATHRVWFVRPCGHGCFHVDVCALCVAELVARSEAAKSSLCAECAQRDFVRLLHVAPLVVL